MKLKVFRRKRWTPSAPGGARQTVGRDSTMVVHHTESSSAGANTWAKQKAIVRGLRDFHVRGNGWDDIGYNWLIFPARFPLLRARIVEGRGTHHVPAAQQGHNTGNVAVAVVCRDEHVSRSTLRALKKLYRHLPCGHVAGHRDYNSTDCPGDRLYAKLGEIRRAK